mmetsp:Transcript_23891/g.56241  ORF Transcript_23891/g.56241 Transcript_23891/m.56241 type:complete len:386 (+) Transcript_23891:62-1219(+)
MWSHHQRKSPGRRTRTKATIKTRAGTMTRRENGKTKGTRVGTTRRRRTIGPTTKDLGAKRRRTIGMTKAGTRAQAEEEVGTRRRRTTGTTRRAPPGTTGTLVTRSGTRTRVMTSGPKIPAGGMTTRSRTGKAAAKMTGKAAVKMIGKVEERTIGKMEERTTGKAVERMTGRVEARTIGRAEGRTIGRTTRHMAAKTSGVARSRNGGRRTAGTRKTTGVAEANSSRTGRRTSGTRVATRSSLGRRSRTGTRATLVVAATGEATTTTRRAGVVEAATKSRRRGSRPISPKILGEVARTMAIGARARAPALSGGRRSKSDRPRRGTATRNATTKGNAMMADMVHKATTNGSARSQHTACPGEEAVAVQFLPGTSTSTSGWSQGGRKTF